MLSAKLSTKVARLIGLPIPAAGISKLAEAQREIEHKRTKMPT